MNLLAVVILLFLNGFICMPFEEVGFVSDPLVKPVVLPSDPTNIEHTSPNLPNLSSPDLTNPLPQHLTNPNLDPNLHLNPVENPPNPVSNNPTVLGPNNNQFINPGTKPISPEPPTLKPGFDPLPFGLPKEEVMAERARWMDGLDLGSTKMRSTNKLPSIGSQNFEALDLIPPEKLRDVIGPDMTIVTGDIPQDQMPQLNFEYLRKNKAGQKLIYSFTETLYKTIFDRLKQVSGLKSVQSDKRLANTPEKQLKWWQKNFKLDWQIRNLNKIILNAPKTEQPTVVYRKIGLVANVPLGEVFKYFQKDDLVPIKGFTSTSTLDASKVNVNGGVVMKIALPKDFPALYVEQLSGHPAEKEVILPFTLDGTHKTLNYGLRVVDVKQNAKITADNGANLPPQTIITLVPEILDKPIPLTFSKNVFDPRNWFQ